jgi:hypothetical protein
MIINKYSLTGVVGDTGRGISTYVSAPKGVTNEIFSERVNAFKRAFNNVEITVTYTE